MRSKDLARTSPANLQGLVESRRLRCPYLVGDGEEGRQKGVMKETETVVTVRDYKPHVGLSLTAVWGF